MIVKPANGAVLVSATTAVKAAPYVAALVAAGVPSESIRVVASAEMFATGAADATPGTGTTAAAAAAAAADLTAGAAGLVLCGGADVDPRRYGEEPLPGAGVEVLPERDALEWELLAAARERRLPVWAVCRGFQVLNVFFGGSLWQDLPLQRPTAVVHDPDEAPHEQLVHGLRILAPEAPVGERLAAAGTAPRVNSRHHQGVKRLGEGLLAVAAAEDGLIEAAVLGGGPGGASPAGAAGTAGAGAADGDGWWVRGVEWHPENLLALPEQLALWHDFAAALAARRD